ncbi:virulence factor Mce family protein [Prauserella aidingensis]|uniref:MCE family protein n=1 Tax=Prauserella aidingensis TaxID=387890 RepID=UPI0020A43638|nr:MCE family protein [Prauserella aidingensis]MCP2251632.1 virulence factor Mce family protein [Prauserella aidingensis]
MRSHRRDTGRTALALRGVAAATALVVGAGVLIAAGNDALRPAPEVTALLPASAGPVRENSAVQYHGVTVGRLTTVDGGIDGSELRLRMDEEFLGQVPANVRVRVLPRTLFGDQYVDLAVPRGAEPRGSLDAGATLRPDTSRRTVRLYSAYTRLYDVITALRPAELQVAMTTLADTVRGRGERLGRMIDDADALLTETSPLLETLEEDLDTVARLSSDVEAATPDLLATVDNATSLATTITEERRSIGALLGSAIDLTDTGRRVVSDHAQRIVTLAEATGPIADVLARHPGAAGESLDAARFFLTRGARTFATGNFTIDAALTLDQPFPYTAADCPRYPGLAGQNCRQAPSSRHDRTFPQPQHESGTDHGRGGDTTARGDDAHGRDSGSGPVVGGTSGPVGSEREKRSLRELGGLLPAGPRARTSQDPDLLGLMLGPLVRGETVVVP